MMSSSKTASAKKRGLPYNSEALRRDVMRVQSAWKKYQRSHRRSAIYKFLDAIFEIITIWEADGRARSRAHRAMSEERCRVPRSIEPYSATMVIAAHPETIDDRTLAKWSRVLRFAQEHKLPSTPLRKFIRRKGGINECAALFTRRLGRGFRPDV